MSKFIPVETEKWAEILTSEARLKGRVIALEAELESEKSAHKALRSLSFTTAVPSEDYEKLKEENARLKAEVERLRKFNEEALAHIAKEERKSRERLEIEQAEVERLRKAGDAMADQIYNEGKVRGVCYTSNIEAWNSAKDGKPSV